MSYMKLTDGQKKNRLLWAGDLLTSTKQKKRLFRNITTPLDGPACCLGIACRRFVPNKVVRAAEEYKKDRRRTYGHHYPVVPKTPFNIGASDDLYELCGLTDIEATELAAVNDIDTVTYYDGTILSFSELTHEEIALYLMFTVEMEELPYDG